MAKMAKAKTKKAKGEKKPRIRKPRTTTRTTERTPRSDTKTAGIIEMLKGKGATVAEIQEFAGWKKSASVHGLLSGTLRKKMGFNLVAQKGEDGQNIYRIKAA